MKIRLSRSEDTGRLFAIWDRAVAATHDFLDPDHRSEIAKLVRDDYLPVTPFWIAADEEGEAIGFMALTGHHVDALFVDPDHHGRGIGRALIDHAATIASDLTVDVNEQNDRAVAFYERLGFRVTGRSACDDQGRPYPILHMRLIR